jgi:hypothetical protein
VAVTGVVLVPVGVIDRGVAVALVRRSVVRALSLRLAPDELPLYSD